ncbi:hypothetical protein [Streptomyces mutomycini]|uniref:hypothetical protein n=1 Tax=Streptomyces mutomycini TaxID=284036 RepID=UPI0033CCA604
MTKPVPPISVPLSGPRLILPTLLVGCDDGNSHLTARLDALLSRAAADALGEPLDRQTTDPEVMGGRMTEGALVRVEVRAGTGRSRVVRVRGEG